MRPLHLDFLQHPPRLTPGGVALLVAACVALGAISIFQATLSDEVEALNREFGALRGRGAADRFAAGRFAGKDIPAEVRGANALIGRLALPWEDLFAVLEGAQDFEVALLGVEPEAEKRGLVITGEAKTLEDLLEFIRYLQEQDSLSGVTLQSHKVNQQDREKPVRFRVVAAWVIKS